MKRQMVAHPRSIDRSRDDFDGRPCADDVCGEALFDTLFDRTQALDHAADQGRVPSKSAIDIGRR